MSLTARRTLTIELAATLLTLLAALAFGFIFLVVTGKDAGAAYASLLAGPLARPPRVGRWLEVAGNLTVAGLAFAIPYKAKQINLGVSSQALIGGLAAGLTAGMLPTLPIVSQLAAVLAATLAGFLLGLIPGLLKAYLGASEIVVTLMLNFIVGSFLQLMLGLVFAMFSAGAFLGGVGPVNGFPRLRELISADWGTLHLGVFVAIAAVIALWLLMNRTPFGYEVRTTGANERFARYGGINTRRAMAVAFGVGGACAALAGANLALGYPRDLFVSAADLTFDSIVVALLARAHPLLMLVAGLVYGYLLVGADYMEIQTSVGFEVVRIIQGVLILLMGARILPDLMKRFRRTPSTLSQG